MNLSTAIASYKEVKVTEISDEESPHELIRIVFGVLQDNLETLQQNVQFTDERWERPFNKCMFALSIVMKTLPIGITYASFAGLAIIATVFVGVLKYNQVPNLYATIGLFFIIVGVLMVNLLGSS